MVNKIFVFDLDGTLLPHGNNMRLSDKTVYALESLENIGYMVVLNTGKSFEMCQEPLSQFAFKYTITSNGQVVSINGRNIYNGSFQKEQLLFWRDFAFERNLVIGFQATSKQYILSSDEAEKYAVECFKHLSVPIPKREKDIDYSTHVQQLWLLGDIDNIDLPDDYDYFKWHNNGMDVQLKGINKGVGLKNMLDFLALSSCEIFAFGDGSNDIAMFEFANTSIAVENASDYVKSKADYITEDVYSDGVYNYLVRHGFIREKGME